MLEKLSSPIVLDKEGLTSFLEELKTIEEGKINGLEYKLITHHFNILLPFPWWISISDFLEVYLRTKEGWFQFRHHYFLPIDMINTLTEEIECRLAEIVRDEDDANNLCLKYMYYRGPEWDEESNKREKELLTEIYKGTKFEFQKPLHEFTKRIYSMAKRYEVK